MATALFELVWSCLEVEVDGVQDCSPRQVCRELVGLGPDDHRRRCSKDVVRAAINPITPDGWTISGLDRWHSIHQRIDPDSRNRVDIEHRELRSVILESETLLTAPYGVEVIVGTECLCTGGEQTPEPNGPTWHRLFEQ